MQGSHPFLRTGVPTWHLVMDEMGGRLPERCCGCGLLTSAKGRSSIWLTVLKICRGNLTHEYIAVADLDGHAAQLLCVPSRYQLAVGCRCDCGSAAAHLLIGSVQLRGGLRQAGLTGQQAREVLAVEYQLVQVCAVLILCTHIEHSLRLLSPLENCMCHCTKSIPALH